MPGLSWTTPDSREGNIVLEPYEIAYYQLYKDHEPFDMSQGNTYSLKKNSCGLYYITTVDTDNLESKPSNTICVCPPNRLRNGKG